MQELLTGKRRLPGFSGEWIIKEIQDICEVDPDTLNADTRPDYTFKYITLESVDRGKLNWWVEHVYATAPSRARRKIRRNDILISTVRPNLQSHYLNQHDFGDLVCSTGFSVLRCQPGIADPYFIFSNFFAAYIQNQIEAILTGSNYPSINSSDVRRLKLFLPLKFEEQEAVSEILSDMDTEILLLEGKLIKARQIKQGMMQELLTGRIRLG